jgi:hypothetical protein
LFQKPNAQDFICLHVGPNGFDESPNKFQFFVGFAMLSAKPKFLSSSLLHF